MTVSQNITEEFSPACSLFNATWIFSWNWEMTLQMHHSENRTSFLFSLNICVWKDQLEVYLLLETPTAFKEHYFFVPFFFSKWKKSQSLKIKSVYQVLIVLLISCFLESSKNNFVTTFSRSLRVEWKELLILLGFT